MIEEKVLPIRLEQSEFVAFEEIENGKIIKFNGLKNFVTTTLFGKPTWIVDNHNGVLYYWTKFIKENPGEYIVYHIDQHADLNRPDIFLSEKDLLDDKKLFDYSHCEIDRASFIVPALKLGIINDCKQMRSVYALLHCEPPKNFFIVDLDCDFFVGINKDDQKKCFEKIINLIKEPNCQAVSIATSPGYISHKEAVEIIESF